ncbi:ATP dependent DNA ligase domain protein [Aspergillus lucknowensis]|uniref:ATP-dependent DNA ligase family profile domain-containing protein n=1 Tax=Aspergillus lucknowensis TaxID=176173 RepID=A0ABR4LFC0_9EURO
MGFKFPILCDLLSSLEDNKVLKATTQARSRNPDARVVSQWFAQHDRRLRAPDTDQLALLSCMFPEKRTDRVYWLQDTSLARVIGRCLLLGSSRREELERWRISGGADLGQCVEDVMRQAENHIVSDQEVTVEDVDYALNQIASRCRFSGPQVRRQCLAVDVEEMLSPLYRRLSSRDAKWLTRMILKTHFSDIIPEKLTLRSFHFLLPHLLLFQDSFEAAVKLLSSTPISHFPPRPEPGLAKDLSQIALHHLIPKVGVKIGRPEYYKARSMKHCCRMIGQRRMSVERKYDGEYCQIHIDLSKHPNSIQIFSKSGRDSTTDRSGIHQAIKDSLRINRPGCKFSNHCVLEGELLVWSDEHQKIMRFHKLRKFIPRSGTFIGTESDSPPQPYEHLMIVFFDILLLDDHVCLRKPHRQRRLLLKSTVQVIPGLADIAEQRVIDFSRSDGQSRLESLFSMAIAKRWEGFVLKGCEDPYFPILLDAEQSYVGCWIKLKKDYIPGLGDTIDLALIGAAYNARHAACLEGANKVSLTHFFVGCLQNKNALLQAASHPRFLVVDMIDRHCMSEVTMQTLNNLGKYRARSRDSNHKMDIEYGRPGIPEMDVIFKTPFVVEMLGSGFEKPSGTRYYTLRFPRILKIHTDRSLEDVVSFQELQLLAEGAISVPPEELVEEGQAWANSSTAIPGYLPTQSQSISPASSPIPCIPSTFTEVRAKEHSFVPTSRPECSGRASQEGQNKREPITTADAIPIYVDRATTGSSINLPEVDARILACNGNNSSHGICRKRKASQWVSEPCNGGDGSEAIKEARIFANLNIMAPKYDCSADCQETREANRSRRSSTTHNRSVIPHNTPTIDCEDINSPLSTAPIYITSEILFEQYREKFTGLANIARTCDEFLLMLKTEDHTSLLEKSNSATVSVGIIFEDDAGTSLATRLLDLSRRLTQSMGVPVSNYSSWGRIYLLSSEFLRLDVSPRDTKFCLRKTWEKLSRDYFYACIAWESDACSGTSTDEILGSPVNDSPNHQRSSAFLTHICVPKLRISFDRRELLLLGGD